MTEILLEPAAATFCAHGFHLAHRLDRIFAFWAHGAWRAIRRRSTTVS
ncbi:MAG: hypothetical protein K9M98_14235 [Cephaloticoccus sp.]|nr:hypothetical protein [Cephaloticoccus sp.]